jgi:hypothetical protein
MPTTLTRAIHALQERSDDDPALAEAVIYLAEELGGPADPFGSVPTGALQAAQVVNRRRLAERRQEAASHALDTAAVVALVRTIGDRKGVDRRRRRGQLLGWRSGAGTLHPAWQFDSRRGDTVPGLPRVLTVLAEVAPDPQVADELMRAPRSGLDGGSLAELLAAGKVESVIRLIRSTAEQS